MALGAYHRTGRDYSCGWRMALRFMGHLLSHGHRPPLYLAGELCHSYVGIAAVFHGRYIQKQLLGGAADVWRRLAQ